MPGGEKKILSEVFGCISLINDSLWSKSCASSPFFRVIEVMILYHSTSTSDSTVGVRKRRRGLSKGEEKMGRGIQSQAKDDRQAREQLYKLLLDLFQRLVCWGEWQLLIKMVADYHIRSDTIYPRPGVEDKSLLFVENSNLKICIFRWTSVVCFLMGDMW